MVSESDKLPIRYREERKRLWDKIAHWRAAGLGWGNYYHQRLVDIYRFIIPAGMRVLEIGCAEGDLLAALKPSQGVGIDFSPQMIRQAKEKYPQYKFRQVDAHDISEAGEFDFVILSDLVNDLWDVQAVLDRIQRVTSDHTRIVINTYSRVWELPLLLARSLRLAAPVLPQNWLTVKDLENLLNLAGYEIIHNWGEVICPLALPFLSPLCNQYLVKLWPCRLLSLSHFIVARPLGAKALPPPEPIVSVIVPARNEEGNIKEIVRRVPEMGAGTEIIFVEGHSTDQTVQAIKDAMNSCPSRRCLLVRQTGEGKGDAVRSGFSNASGDILMILDADLTVPPEDLPRFYNVLVSGRGEFANGVRLVYPMEKEAMRFLNFLGNKFFSLAFSWLLGQSIKDTLCGTKALWRRDYERIADNRDYFGDFDPFGDFDLLFGAAKLNMKIRDVPIRYRERTYGSTNIRRWRHGLLLLRMTLFALRRIKFV